MKDTKEYFSLYEFIPEAFKQFSFTDYYTGELKYLQPALEAMGYEHVYFITGERDSFGPLSRIAVCRKTEDSKPTYYVYG